MPAAAAVLIGLVCASTLTVAGQAADTQAGAKPMDTNSSAPNTSTRPLYLDPTQPVDKRVADLLPRLTVEEKIDYIGGTNGFYIGAIERLQLPAIKMSDGPMGSRNDGPTTCYPAGIGLAATWDREMATKIGVALGRDCRSRGVHILLAPAVNIYRSPLCGRNFEYMGEDPFLAGQMVAPLISGIQSQEVLATVKHYACNNQEWDRHNISSELDERTLHEIYLPAFKAAVQQGKAGCVMTAYNLVNGVHCSQDDYLINQVLKDRWGFNGFVMSDWTSTYDGVACANGGLDLEMPSARMMNSTNLLPALQDGRVKQSVIDDKVRRILRTIIAAGFLDRPQLRSDISRDDAENDRVALEGAREGIVLLKNKTRALPIDRHSIKTIAVVGPNADPAVYCGGGSAFTRVFKSVSILEGVRQLAGESVKVLYSTNADDAVELARQADAAIVCVGFNQRPTGLENDRRARLTESEGRDRPFELPAGQTNLIRAVSAANPRTIVVINAGGAVDMTTWLEGAKSVLQAWYSGQESGRAVAEILFGDVNPSGKLPATFEKRWEDNPTSPYYHLRENHKSPYTEGIFVGYRGYDEKNIDPQFCFGHGLSYTEFQYGKAAVSPGRITADARANVSVEVRNTGKRAGAEIVQLYIHPVRSSVPQPPKQLRGFQRVSLKPGEKKTVTIPLTADQISFYDVKTHQFVVEPGEFEIMVGSSSRDIRSHGKLEVIAAR
ncbi:MAG TPA: glycoside hydrolase family 3 C-terminal domain-containing protein [Verrucomicrobiae bacterium]|nr:glycoside hydrolase family 3 C-terminal domain-containing protein [Verrucomicrobiae bacterium]